MSNQLVPDANRVPLASIPFVGSGAVAFSAAIDLSQLPKIRELIFTVEVSAWASPGQWVDVVLQTAVTGATEWVDTRSGRSNLTANGIYSFLADDFLLDKVRLKLTPSAVITGTFAPWAFADSTIA